MIGSKDLYTYFLECLITMVKSQMNQFQKDFLRKGKERTEVSEFTILAQKLLKITALRVFLGGLCNLLLMGLGQHQQQHPAMHSGGQAI